MLELQRQLRRRHLRTSGSAPAARSTTTRSTTTTPSTRAPVSRSSPSSCPARPVRQRSDAGTGAVDIDRNLIQANFSRRRRRRHLRARRARQPVNIRNNMIVDNGAAVIGGGDHARRLVQREHRQQHHREQRHARARRRTRRSACRTRPAWRPRATTRDFQAIAVPERGPPDFSNPVALFNNIFWNNNAFTLDQFGPGATLVNQGFIDFEIARDDEQRGHLHPALLGPDQRADPGPERGAARRCPGAGQHDRRRPDLRDAVHRWSSASRGRGSTRRQAAVTITGADPPVGLTGDYHIALPTGLGARLIAALVSPIIDRGARCSNTPSGPPGPGPNTTHASRAGSQPRTSTTTASRGRRS